MKKEMLLSEDSEYSVEALLLTIRSLRETLTNEEQERVLLAVTAFGGASFEQGYLRGVEDAKALATQMLPPNQEGLK